MQHQGGNWLSILLPFAIIAAVVALRLRSMSRERPLKLGSLWVVPVIYAAVAASMLVALPPPPLGWGLVALGLVAGLVVGWHRGKLIRIERNAQTGELRQRASPLAASAPRNNPPVIGPSPLPLWFAYDRNPESRPKRCTSNLASVP